MTFGQENGFWLWVMEKSSQVKKKVLNFDLVNKIEEKNP